MLRDLFSLFPAYAGVILQDEPQFIMDVSFPRIRGGDPYDDTVEVESYFFSPHTRG